MAQGSLTRYIFHMYRIISGHAILHPLYAESAICVCPLHQATMLVHWAVYSWAWSLSNPGCRWISRNWIQTKQNISLRITEEQVSLYIFNWALRCRNWPNKFCSELIINYIKKFIFYSHICVVCSLHFYHIWDLRRIRRCQPGSE